MRRCFSFFMLAPLTTKQPEERAFKIVYNIQKFRKIVWNREREIGSLLTNSFLTARKH